MAAQRRAFKSRLVLDYSLAQGPNVKWSMLMNKNPQAEIKRLILVIINVLPKHVSS
jgi:hypothetical protein